MTFARLPQLDRLFLTDAGLESDMIYTRGFNLPCFASIMLLTSDRGRRALDDYFREFLDLARASRTGCLLETATWRASSDWAEPLGLSRDALDTLNWDATDQLRVLADEYRADGLPVVVSGCIGPRGDGYDPGMVMPAGEAEAYHRGQAAILAGAGADMLSALTMTNVSEATGIAMAARSTGLPVAISFTVETDGRIPMGETLGEAIAATDAASDAYPAYYMVNCAHPTHFAEALLGGGTWTQRVRGIRANASRCSHAELDAMTELDSGDPAELGSLYRKMTDAMPWLTVLGGCCGTDIRHVRAIAESCVLDPHGSRVAA